MRSLALVLAAAAALVVSSTTGAAPAPREGTAATASKAKVTKAQALKKCKKVKKVKRRKACVKRVKKAYAKPKPPAQPAPAAIIDVRDDYFSPDAVSIKSGQSVLWVWNEINHDAHNLTLLDGPKGVKKLDFETANAPANRYSFQRTFKIPGMYHLACSLHHLMRIDVMVSK